MIDAWYVCILSAITCIYVTHLATIYASTRLVFFLNRYITETDAASLTFRFDVTLYIVCTTYYLEVFDKDH